MSEKPKRGRPPKDEEVIQVTVRMPKALVDEVDAYAAFASKNLYKNVNRAEAVRDLVTFAIRTWRTKYEKNPNAEPSLL